MRITITDTIGTGGSLTGHAAPTITRAFQHWYGEESADDADQLIGQLLRHEDTTAIEALYGISINRWT